MTKIRIVVVTAILMILTTMSVYATSTPALNEPSWYTGAIKTANPYFFVSEVNNMFGCSASPFTVKTINGYDMVGSYDGGFIYGNATNSWTSAVGDSICQAQINASNHDILRYGTTTIFFQGPPPNQLEVMKTLNLTLVLSQIVGLVPLLIGLVAGFLALRKGLSTLSTLLRQA